MRSILACRSDAGAPCYACRRGEYGARHGRDRVSARFRPRDPLAGHCATSPMPRPRGRRGTRPCRDRRLGRAAAGRAGRGRPVGRRRLSARLGRTRPAVLRRLDRDALLAELLVGVRTRTPRRPRARRGAIASCARTCAGTTTASRTSRARSSRASTAARSRAPPTSGRTARTSARRCWRASSPTAAGTAGTRTARAARPSTPRSARSRGCGRGSRRAEDRMPSPPRVATRRGVPARAAPVPPRVDGRDRRSAVADAVVSDALVLRRACAGSTTSAVARPERDERCAEAIELLRGQDAAARPVEARD